MTKKEARQSATKEDLSVAKIDLIRVDVWFLDYTRIAYSC